MAETLYQQAKRLLADVQKDAGDAWRRHGWHGRDDVRRAKALRDYVPSIETKGDREYA